ncbi:substrate-binding domain-containing protein [Bacillus shivajii]|uniref:LacI family DNA-binding transcriptional regulator n=1 Tax=Bacillus shivajii TaxID=1983719 RepID=UPI001CFAA47B|nr:substrate-binding domain-containing protein [Bacillus shivajii]UCZ54407.1 substrate-binding domain-containing protein [Bacillus shivajii]
MSITIKDVAKKAGVSIATVSRIINEQSGYSQRTKDKVVRVIEDLGYTPNALARGLVGKETKTIGVLLPKVSGLYASRLLEGIERRANAENYSVLVCHLNSSDSRAVDDLQVLKEKQVDGIIYASEEMSTEQGNMLQTFMCPVILVSTKSMRFSFPYIKVDDVQAAYDGTAYLIGQGHKEIALVSGSADDPIAGKPRIDGFMQAMKDHDIEVNPDLIEYGNFRFESGKRCMEKLMQKRKRFSAVFATSDEMAIGVLSVAYEKGIRIPHDLSVIGYDNTQAAEMAIPPLTTVSQPLMDMGERAVDMMIQQRKQQETVSNFIISHNIYKRQTVRTL